MPVPPQWNKPPNRKWSSLMQARAHRVSRPGLASSADPWCSVTDPTFNSISSSIRLGLGNTHTPPETIHIPITGTFSCNPSLVTKVEHQPWWPRQNTSLSDQGTISTTHTWSSGSITITRPLHKDGALQIPWCQAEICTPVKQVGIWASINTGCSTGLGTSLRMCISLYVWD